MNDITLTREQEKLLATYRKKWRSMILSTEPIDKAKAIESIDSLYQLSHLKQPEIIFFAGPYSAILHLLYRRGKIIKRQLRTHFNSDQSGELLIALCQMLQSILWEQLVLEMRDTPWEVLWLKVANKIMPPEQLLQQIVKANFGKELIDTAKKVNFLRHLDQAHLSYYLILAPERLGNCVWSQINLALNSKFSNFLWNQVGSQLGYQIQDELERILWQVLETQNNQQLSAEFKTQKRVDFATSILQNLTQKYHCSRPPSLQAMRPELWPHDGATIDFCISVLNCEYDSLTWSVFKALKENCGFIFPHEDVCLVCERPVKLSLDSEDRLHAEGEPALQFADGYSIYANHGTILPEKYGKVSPQHWQINWLQQEPNLSVKQNLLLIKATYAKTSQRIFELTSVQEAGISKYLEKWQNFALSIKRIDRQQAENVIKTVYQWHNKPEPSIIFCESPHAAWSTDIFKKQKSWQSWAGIVTTLEEQLKKQLEANFLVQLRRKYGNPDIFLLENSSELLLRNLDSEFGRNSFSWIRWAGDIRLFMVHNHPELWAFEGGYLDFCFSVLGCSYDKSTWHIFQEVVQHCGWIYPYKNVCLVCERPTKISLKKSQIIIEFSDGYYLNDQRTYNF